MKASIEYDIRYIVTKESDDGELRVGDRMHIDYYCNKDKYHGFEHFTIFTPVRPSDKPLFGLQPKNHTRVFYTEKEMLDALKGVEVKLDTDYALRRVNDHLKEIRKLKKDYNLSI